MPGRATRSTPTPKRSHGSGGSSEPDPPPNFLRVYSYGGIEDHLLDPVADVLTDEAAIAEAGWLLREAEITTGAAFTTPTEIPPKPDFRLGAVSPIIGNAPGPPGPLRTATGLALSAGCPEPTPL